MTRRTPKLQEVKITIPCFDCGNCADHMHHVVPKVRGGTKCVPLCAECHGKVHGRLMHNSELIKQGIALSRVCGQVFGRPRSIDPGKVWLLRLQGLSLSKIAKQLKCTKGAVSKILSKNPPPLPNNATPDK